MQFWHQSKILLCGALFVTGAAGCAGTGIVTAQQGASGPLDAAPERLVSIGQVFESQGRLTSADQMYRLALRRDPDNETARRQINYIASLRETRSFETPGVNGTPAPDIRLAADSSGQAELKSMPKNAPAAVETVRQPTIEDLAAEARESLMQTVLSDRAPETEHSGEAPVAGVASLRPVDDSSRLNGIAIKVSKPTANRPTTSRPTVIEPALRASVVEEPAAAQHPVATTPLRELPAQVTSFTGPAVMEAPATAKPHSMKLMAAWMRAPEKHVTPLLMTLRTSPDVQQRALAATLLAEAPAGDPRVNPALQNHCQTNEAAVAVAAVDSLLARGVTSESSVRTLKLFAEHPESEIRNQVVSSMRRLVGTTWETQAAQILAARLDDSDPVVRGMAALTLGDFSSEGQHIVERLCDRYQIESDEGVRASLELAAQRIAVLPNQESSSGVQL